MGPSAALNVDLRDNSFHPDAFAVVGGQLNIKLDRIAPGTNVSHVVVVRPRKSGYFNFTAAEVSYQPSEEVTEVSDTSSFFNCSHYQNKINHKLVVQNNDKLIIIKIISEVL